MSAGPTVGCPVIVGTHVAVVAGIGMGNLSKGNTHALSAFAESWVLVLVDTKTHCSSARPCWRQYEAPGEHFRAVS